MGLGDLLRGLRGGKDKPVPASEALRPMRESSGVLKAVRPTQPAVGARQVSEPTPVTVTPALGQPQNAGAPPPIMPPAWSDVFPAHHKALLADLQKRGEDPKNWEIQDGRDLGVSDAGHTIAFRVHKTGTSATISVELTLFKGKLANVRVR